MLDHGLHDRTGRPVTLREVDAENWRAVADVAPHDAQRRFVAALGARYLLLSLREEVWHSLAVCAGGDVAGHVMWGRDEDGAYWIGGLLVDASEQGRGVGPAAARTLVRALTARADCRMVRLSCDPENTAALRMWTALGFRPTGDAEDGEIVAELTVPPS
jgi:diamine N-acetyltransferase